MTWENSQTDLCPVNQLDEIKRKAEYTNKEGLLWKITKSDIDYLIRKAEMFERMTGNLEGQQESETYNGPSLDAGSRLKSRPGF